MAGCGILGQGTGDFDPGAGTTNLTTNGSTVGDDVFVSKLDSAGDLVWAKNFGGTEYAKGFSVAVDSSGNVYTSGEFEGTVDFDPGAGTANLTSSGSNSGNSCCLYADDVFVLKL